MVRFQITKKEIMILMFLIVLIPIITAEESFIFKQGDDFTLEIAMANNNLSDCSACSCVYSIFYPNGSSFIRKADGVNVDSFCQYTNATEITGTYGVQMDFNNSVDYGRASFEFEVTPSGKIISTSQGLLVNLSIFIIILGACFCTFLGMKVKNPFVSLSLISFAVILIIFALGMALNILGLSFGSFGGITDTYSSLYVLMTVLVSVGGLALIVYLIKFALTLYWESRGIIDKEFK